MSDPSRNYYRDLGCKPSDDQATLKSGYRKVARETHSDANGGSDRLREAFERAAQAWEVLGDPARRAEWTNARREWLSARGAVECQGCGAGLRLAEKRVQRCPICKAEVQPSHEPTGGDDLTERLFRPLADSGRRIGVQLVDATESEAERLGRELMNESARLLGQLIVKGFSAARRRMRGH